MLQKIPIYWYTEVTCLHITCTCNLSHYEPCTSGNVPKKKIFWIFSQWVMNNLTIGLPYAWKHSESTLHILLKGYILSYLNALEEDNLWEQRDYSGFVPHSCILEFASLCPWCNHWCSFPIFPLSCGISLIWRIELVEDSVSWFRRGADRGCHLYLCLHLIEISISHPLYV